jgi:hypothetical protein
VTLETLNFLCEILASVSVSASDADFDEKARKVGNARRELIAAVHEATDQAQLDAELAQRGLAEETRHVVSAKDPP